MTEQISVWGAGLDLLQTTLTVQVFETLGKHIHDDNVSKGFWSEDRNEGEIIALIHSELSEALEALRTNPNGPSDKPIPTTALAEELADAVIRILDYSSARNIDLGEAILLKLAYNRTRPHKHGKAF